MNFVVDQFWICVHENIKSYDVNGIRKINTVAKQFTPAAENFQIGKMPLDLNICSLMSICKTLD